MKEEEEHDPDQDEEEKLLKQAMEDSLHTHAVEELRMCPGMDIILRRSAEEAQHPPPAPLWYETMARGPAAGSTSTQGAHQPGLELDRPAPQLYPPQEQPLTAQMRVTAAHLWARHHSSTWSTTTRRSRSAARFI